MIQIVIDNNRTKIITNDLNICIEESFEINKKGAEAPTINVIANNQKLFEQ